MRLPDGLGGKQSLTISSPLRWAAAALLVAAIVCAFSIGCSHSLDRSAVSAAASDRTAPVPLDSEPDSLVASAALPESPAQQPVALPFAELSDWDALYRQALTHTAEARWCEAEDLLFLLQDRVQDLQCDRADSAMTAYHRSYARRLFLLGGLVAEGMAFADHTVGHDSLLADRYGRLSRLDLPDSLVPITGRTRKALAADLLLVENDRVDRWLDYFTGPGRRQVGYWLEKKTGCDSLVHAILAENDLPRELIYLAVIESGLSPHARSGVGAVGPWQFMPGTAKRFDLRCDWWVDERRDLEFATRAAAAYLRELYDLFGDWALVLAGYNAGEHRIARSIRLCGHDDFWKLHLPRQTADHIPKFIAVARIGENPDDYGFTIQQNRPLGYDIVPVDDATDLAVVARCAGVATDEVLKLNPGLKRRTSPPDTRDYPVRVPHGQAPRCRRELAKIPAGERLTWRRHRISRGETLSEIASSYGTRVADLREVNEISNVNRIRPGDQILIPMPAKLADKARQRVSHSGHYVPPDGYERVSYKVKKGDTLSGIAQKLQVSLRHLRRVNGLRSSLIKPGQKLFAYRAPRPHAAKKDG